MSVASKDIEILWGRYQSEGVSKGVSVSLFFSSNGIPYRVFKSVITLFLCRATHRDRCLIWNVKITEGRSRNCFKG